MAYLQLKPQTEELIRRLGEDRVVVILGTSTSGLEESDAYISACNSHRAYPHYHYSQQEPGDLSEFFSGLLHLRGPAYTISTACSSASWAVISAPALIEAGVVDVAIAGGSDSLNRMTINGFHSMGQLLAERSCLFVGIGTVSM